MAAAMRAIHAGAVSRAFTRRSIRAFSSYRAVQVTDGEISGVAEGTLPVPGDGEVLIATKAAGINRPDVLQRKGLYPPPPGVTDVLGLEVAGVVAAVGPGFGAASPDHPIQVGTPVCALVSGGGYGTHAVADARHCLPIPRGFSFLQAAALPETFFTVWANLFSPTALGDPASPGFLGLRAGERLLVHGGTSGIGTTAVQLATHYAGAEGVYTTCGANEKCAFAEELGGSATKAINYNTAAAAAEADGDAAPGAWLPQALRGAIEANGADFDGGVDVVLDMVGGAYAGAHLNVLRPKGRCVSIAFLGGSRPPPKSLDLMPMMLKQLRLTGNTLRRQPAEFKAALAQELGAAVWPLLESGAVAPVMGDDAQVFALEDAAKAHAMMEAGEHVGKIVLRVDE